MTWLECSKCGRLISQRAHERIGPMPCGVRVPRVVRSTRGDLSEVSGSVVTFCDGTFHCAGKLKPPWDQEARYREAMRGVTK